MSVVRAGREMAPVTGVTVGGTTVRWGTETAGAAYVVVQTVAVARIEREVPAPPEGPTVQDLSVDRAMVPLVGGGWGEGRPLALGTVVVREIQTRRDRERTVHAESLSYASRLTDHETVARLATVETQRRGTETAGVVCAVADGAPWITDVVALHRADAVRIPDWPRALGDVARGGRRSRGRRRPRRRRGWRGSDARCWRRTRAPRRCWQRCNTDERTWSPWRGAPTRRWFGPGRPLVRPGRPASR